MTVLHKLRGDGVRHSEALSCVPSLQTREAPFAGGLQQTACRRSEHQPEPDGAGFVPQRAGQPGGEAAVSGAQTPRLQASEPEPEEVLCAQLRLPGPGGRPGGQPESDQGGPQLQRAGPAGRQAALRGAPASRLQAAGDPVEEVSAGGWGLPGDRLCAQHQSTSGGVGPDGKRAGGFGAEAPVSRLEAPRVQAADPLICHLTAAACEELASTLAVNRSLMELDLSLNDLGDPGALLLCEGLRHPQCSLQTVRLGICRLSSATCEGICTVLRVNPHLRELDLSFNDLGDTGMWPLCEGLRHPTCRLQKLWLDSCGLTAKACEDLSSALGVSQTLTELYLTNNALGNAGVRLLCKGLSHPGCKLQVLWLFGMPLNKTTHRRLAALRLMKPHLDIGC